MSAAVSTSCLPLTTDYTRILFKCEDGWKSTLAKIFSLFALIIYPLLLIIDLFKAACCKVTLSPEEKNRQAWDLAVNAVKKYTAECVKQVNEAIAAAKPNLPKPKEGADSITHLEYAVASLRAKLLEGRLAASRFSNGMFSLTDEENEALRTAYGNRCNEVLITSRDENIRSILEELAGDLETAEDLLHPKS